MRQTRRRILRSLAGILAGGGGVGWGMTLNHPPADKSITNQKQSDSHTKTTMNRAYLALPGISFSSLIVNLPYIAKEEFGSPLIVMDSHDYNRLQGQAVRERGNQKAQYLRMIYDELRRQNVLRLIDYTDYYPVSVQNKHIEQCRSELTSVAEHKNRCAAKQAADGFIQYGLGSYQESFRAGFGDVDRYINHREKVERQGQKIKRGATDPTLWNERVYNQYAAAFDICRRMNRKSDLNVQYIIGQGECSSLSTLVSASPDLGFRTEQPSDPQFFEVDPERSAATREVLDTVSTIAKETTGTQHEDWFLFGPRLALPEFFEIFTSTSVEEKINGLDVKSIVAETQNVLSLLDSEAADNRSVEHVRAEAEWLAEEHGHSPQERQRLINQLEAAVSLSNHSRDLREFDKEGRFSSAALFLAASIKMDPLYRYNEDDVYRRAMTLKNRLEPRTATDTHIENFRNRGGFRRGETGKDWYQAVDRWR